MFCKALENKSIDYFLNLAFANHAQILYFLYRDLSILFPYFLMQGNRYFVSAKYVYCGRTEIIDILQ
jgi:hypothetical protein